MQNQAPESILMIRPSNFGYNPSTAQSNAFQSSEINLKPDEISDKARKEFDIFVELLSGPGINTIVIEDKKDMKLPDSVFPNNWISFHHNGTVVLYPMLAENRRLERRQDILLKLQNKHNFNIEKILDYTNHEQHGRFWEGTGSVVFDYKNNIAYANVSPRTDEIVFNKMCDDMGYEKVMFVAQDPSGLDIYHTNVMMCIADKYVVICLDAVVDKSMRIKLLHSFENTGHEIIEINFRQLGCFAGNMIEVQNQRGESVVVMSESAHTSLGKDQLRRLSKHSNIIYAPIPVIEKYGGGSVRCMIAGIFLPRIEYK
jgi:hypothetical protein